MREISDDIKSSVSLNDFVVRGMFASKFAIHTLQFVTIVPSVYNIRSRVLYLSIDVPVYQNYHESSISFSHVQGILTLLEYCLQPATGAGSNCAVIS